MNNNQTFRKLPSINEHLLTEMEITIDKGVKRVSFPLKNEFTKAILTGDISWFSNRMQKNKFMEEKCKFSGLLAESEIEKMKNKNVNWAYSVLITANRVYSGPTKPLRFKERQDERLAMLSKRDRTTDRLKERKDMLFSNISAISPIEFDNKDIVIISQFASEIVINLVQQTSALSDSEIKVLQNGMFTGLHQIAMFALIYWNKLADTAEKYKDDSVRFNVIHKSASDLLGKILNCVVNNFNVVDMHERVIKNQKAIIEKGLAGLNGVYDFNAESGLLISRIGIRGLYFPCNNQDALTVTNIALVDDVGAVKKSRLPTLADSKLNMTIGNSDIIK